MAQKAYKGVIHTTVDESSWNDRVASVSAGTLFQTTYLVHNHMLFDRLKPRYIIVTDSRSGEVVGQLLYYVGFPVATVTEKQILRKSIALVGGVVLRHVSWVHGPLIFDPVNSSKIFIAIIEAVLKHVKSRCPSGIQNVTLPLYGQWVNCDSFHFNEIMCGYGFIGRQWGTFVVNLDLPGDTLWSNLKKNVRYELRRAEKDGIIIKEVKNLSDLRKSHELRKQSSRYNKIITPPFDRMRANWETLTALDSMMTFNAYHNDILVGVMSVMHFNGIATIAGLATSNYARANKIYAMQLLLWHAINWTREKGLRWFDLAGVNTDENTRTEKEWGIYLFKSKWGGELVRYNTFTKIYSPWKESLLKQLRNLAKRIVK